MQRLSRALVVVLLVLASVGSTAVLASPPPQMAPPIRVLAYSATYGFRHASIDTAVAELRKLNDFYNAGITYDVDVTTDPAKINGRNLSRYDVLFFVNATGEHPFSAAQRTAMMSWIRSGGGFVATHASADGNYYWPEYGNLVGAYFLAHPHTGEAVNKVEDRRSPFVSHLPARYTINEEYYRFQLDPRPNVHVLTSLDKSTAGTASGQTYVEDQPTTWCQRVGRGRSFYTAWGHFDASFTNPDVWRMLVTAIDWGAGRRAASCAPTVPVPTGRRQAEDASQIAFAETATSDQAGAEVVVSKVLNQGYLRFDDINLDGLKSLRVKVAGMTMAQPKPYHVPVSPPALGGTIRLRLDSVGDGKKAASCPFAGHCEQKGDVATATVERGSAWHTVDIPLSGKRGVHDIFLVFTEPMINGAAATRLFVPEATDSAYLMSVDWVRPIRAARPAPRAAN